MSVINNPKDTNKKELYSIVPERTESHSNAASFCRVLAVITWIGGLVIAIASSNVVTLDRYGYPDSSFSFIAFISALIVYIIAGGALYCLAELFDNIQFIADSLRGMKVLGDANSLIAMQQTDRPAASAANNSKDAKTTDTQEDTQKKAIKRNLTGLANKLKEKDVEWVDFSQYGELGKEMVQAALYYTEEQ